MPRMTIWLLGMRAITNSKLRKYPGADIKKKQFHVPVMFYWYISMMIFQTRFGKRNN